MLEQRVGEQGLAALVKRTLAGGIRQRAKLFQLIREFFNGFFNVQWCGYVGRLGDLAVTREYHRQSGDFAQMIQYCFHNNSLVENSLATSKKVREFITHVTECWFVQHR
ncbi:hypothetical protein [Aquabacterium sp. CECT 9606]|uniref:hypothetical protein n=1 Tax=Aquabacterium sp. CECT 9606 TaxID=2845822 RepID=UPI001E3F8F3A|nr:hypothetical protein [Aquabacterium sp. CECT 9606]